MFDEVAKLMYQRGMLTAIPAQPATDDMVLATWSRYLVEASDLPAGEAERLSGFRDWLDKYAPTLGSVGAVTMRLGITRDYGVISVQFAIERAFIVGDNDLVECMRALDREVRMVARQWEADNLSNQPSSSPQQPPVTESIRGVLEHVYDGSRHKFRLKGGKFTMFGVPVYAEELARIGITDTAPLGAVGEFEGEVVYDQNNKPRRVVSLKRL